MFKLGLKRVCQTENKVRRWIGNLNVNENKPIQKHYKKIQESGFIT